MSAHGCRKNSTMQSMSLELLKRPWGPKETRTELLSHLVLSPSTLLNSTKPSRSPLKKNPKGQPSCFLLFVYETDFLHINIHGPVWRLLSSSGWEILSRCWRLKRVQTQPIDTRSLCVCSESQCSEWDSPVYRSEELSSPCRQAEVIAKSLSCWVLYTQRARVSFLPPPFLLFLFFQPHTIVHILLAAPKHRSGLDSSWLYRPPSLAVIERRENPLFKWSMSDGNRKWDFKPKVSHSCFSVLLPPASIFGPSLAFLLNWMVKGYSFISTGKTQTHPWSPALICMCMVLFLVHSGLSATFRQHLTL